MNTPTTNASHANELSYRNGYDLCLAAELADAEAEQEADDEFWERDGKREMLEMLDLGDY